MWQLAVLTVSGTAKQGPSCRTKTTLCSLCSLWAVWAVGLSTYEIQSLHASPHPAYATKHIRPVLLHVCDRHALPPPLFGHASRTPGLSPAKSKKISCHSVRPSACGILDQDIPGHNRQTHVNWQQAIYGWFSEPVRIFQYLSVDLTASQSVVACSFATCFKWSCLGSLSFNDAPARRCSQPSLPKPSPSHPEPPSPSTPTLLVLDPELSE